MTLISSFPQTGKRRSAMCWPTLTTRDHQRAVLQFRGCHGGASEPQESCDPVPAVPSAVRHNCRMCPWMVWWRERRFYFRYDPGRNGCCAATGSRGEREADRCDGSIRRGLAAAARSPPSRPTRNRSRRSISARTCRRCPGRGEKIRAIFESMAPRPRSARSMSRMVGDYTS